MEFYVVDPKTSSFTDWSERVRTFLDEIKAEFSEIDGGLYYLGDDIASPWEENSLLFDVPGDDGGVIELRDVDRNFYVFSDDLSMFDDREVQECVGYVARPSRALYGFSWNSQKLCRFHTGPSTDLSFFCQDEEADYPPVLDLNEVWQLLLINIFWLSNSMARIQDLKNRPVEKVHLDFEVDVKFAHPASLDGLTEMLMHEEGFERGKDSLRATFRERDLDWIRQFLKFLPTEAEDFESAVFRAVWRGEWQGEEREIFYTGVERRNLRPFVQLPVHRTSKTLLDKFRTHFKGHRIDRQEYYL